MEKIKQENNGDDMRKKIMKAEVLFCLAYYGTGMNLKELSEKVEHMKYGLAMIDMLEIGDLEYNSSKKHWTLTEQGKKAAKKLYDKK